MDTPALRLPLLEKGTLEQKLTIVRSFISCIYLRPQLKQHDLQSTQLECQILQEEWPEYQSLRKERLAKLSCDLSQREVDILYRGERMEQWDWLFLTYLS
jgi:hypothetical protein